MSSTTNKSLQQLKLKFSGCRKINEKVANVPIFVDKFISRIKIGGLPLSLLKHLSGQLMLLAVLTAGIGACMGIVNNESFISIAPFYAISFLGLYCYFAVSSLVDIPGKIKILHINLVDYLENHLVNRLEQTTLDLKLVQGEERVQEKESARTETNVQAAEEMPETTQKASERPEDSVLSRTEAKELESLLREFLV